MTHSPSSAQSEREAFKPVGRCECTFSQDECEVCEANREAYREWQMENGTSDDKFALHRLKVAEECCERLMSACTDAGCPDGVPMDDWIRDVVARAASPQDPAVDGAGAFNMLAHLQRQRDFSERTFGPGARTKGVVDHIRKELTEIEGNPSDLTEWIDVVILALDGAWRAGGSPQQIIDALVAKQTKNEGRTWPDWRTADPNKAIEHDRSGESCQQCHGKGTVLFRDPEEAWDMTCGVCHGTGQAASPAAESKTLPRESEQADEAVKKEPIPNACVKCGYVGPASNGNLKSGWNQCGRCGRLQGGAARAKDSK